MSLVINSQFRPFTYDEMVKPLVQYREAYDKVEQDYSDLVAQTEMWKDIVNQTNSPEAYAMYKGYSDQLNSIVEDFSKGMTLKNRSALLGMKRGYARDIAPIARASEAMNAANELRVKASPDAIFEVGEYNSIDQFLHGKTANNRYQSKEALTKQTAVITEAAMAEAMKDPEFQKVMDNQYWLIKQHTGGSYEDLTEAMKLSVMSNPLAQNRFSQIRQEMMKKAGIDKYDTAGQNAIISAIDLGLYAGLDKPTMQFQANQGYLNPLQREQLRHMRMAGYGGGGSGRRSSSSRGGSSGQGQSSEEGSGETYVANDIILEDNNGRGIVPNDMKPSDVHGRETSWEDLRRTPGLRRLVENHIGDSDPRQYEFYTWKSSATGRNRVQIVRKQSYTKPGPANPSSRISAEDAYLIDS